MIFNYPVIKGNDYGIMLDEHFTSLERFWNEVVQNPEVIYNSVTAKTVLTLPKNYGWGLRRPDDRIWGWWGPDEKSEQIWTIYQKLITKYRFSLDIVYNDPEFPLIDQYNQIFYWNETIDEHNP